MKKSGGVWGGTKRELKRMSSRPLYALVTLIFPVTAFVIVWSIFCKGVPTELPIAVNDGDHSALSRHLIRMIDASSTIEVAYRVSDPESGLRLIRRGKAYALIVLQRNLEEKVLSGKAPAVIHYYNNGFLLPGSLIARDVREVVGNLSAGLDQRFRQRHDHVTHVVPGAVEPVRLEHHELFNPYLNYTYFLVSTLLPNMLQIFVLVMTVYALGVELKDGTAKEWLACSGGRTWKAILSKLAPYTLLFGIVGIFMNTFLFRYLGVPLRGSPWVIVVATFLLILAYQAVGLFLVSITANLRLALSFSAFYASTAFAFVGVTFPTIGMPLAAKIWAGILPLYYFIKIFVDQAMRGVPFIIDLSCLMALLSFVLFVPVFPLFRMGKLMRNEKYWGRI